MTAMCYAGTLSPGQDFLPNGAAMAMARDALAAARADFRRLACESPGSRGRLPMTRPDAGKLTRGSGATGGGATGGGAVGGAWSGQSGGHGVGQGQRAVQGAIQGNGRGAVRVLSLPAVAQSGGNSRAGASGMANLSASAPRSMGGAVAVRRSSRRGGYGLSWPGAQYMFIMGVMVLATIAAGLELLSQQGFGAA